MGKGYICLTLTDKETVESLKRIKEVTGITYSFSVKIAVEAYSRKFKWLRKEKKAGEKK